MKHLLWTSTSLACLAFSVSLPLGALAADVLPSQLPAVSDINGKIEFSGGVQDMSGVDSYGAFRGGASLSIPVGDLFGIQADLAVADVNNTAMYGGTLHAFTRDPENYLFGVAGGAAFSDNASIGYVGPEVELYLGQVSLEAFAGYMNVNLDGVGAQDKFFAIGDLAFYATDNLRLSIGASDIADFTSGHAGLEWQIDNVGLPLSLTADAKFGENDFYSVAAGVKFYFGGSDKSLIRRHREDDPRNRSLDIFSAAGSAFTPGKSGPNYGTCPSTSEIDIDPGPGLNCVPRDTG